MTAHRLTAYKYLLLVAFIWGLAGPVIKFTLNEFPPIIFLAYRFFLSTIAALALFAYKRPSFPKNSEEREKIGLYGFLTSTIGLGLLFLGYEKTTAISGTILSAVAPLMVAAAGVYFLKDRITKREHIGIGVACVGTIVTVVEPLLMATGSAFTATLEGNLFIIGSLVTGVATAILGKKLLRDHIAPDTLAHVSFIIGFLTMLPVLLITFSPVEIWNTIRYASLSAHAGVWFMALFSGTLAYTLWHKGQKMIEVSEATIFNYLIPLFGTPVAMLWLGETVSLPFVAGSLVIAIGVVIAEWKRKHAAK